MAQFTPMHIDHPDDERYDAIDISIVPRWKESELSGDEWRFSYIAKFKRKGETLFTISASKLDWLLCGLQWRMLTAGEEDLVDMEAFGRTKDKCDQPGCSNVATIFYKRLKPFSKDGTSQEPRPWDEYRQFCSNHTHRGDCGMDDADANYKEIQNPRSI